MSASRDIVLRLERLIAKQSLSPVSRFKLIRKIEILKNQAKRFSGKGYWKPAEVTLVPSNAGYGVEYWLKKYSGYDEDIYAAIEHGIYFGDNVGCDMNPIHEEWQIGSFITFGEYRVNLLRDAYPHHLVIPIGAHIRYTPIDQEYLSYLNSKVDAERERTIAAFPAHSILNGKLVFDHRAFAEAIVLYSKLVDCANRIVCLSPFDMHSGIISIYKDYGFVVASSGTDAKKFLPRQRAIYEIANLTVSNELGTHIGYSVACGTPHTILCPLGRMADSLTVHRDCEHMKQQQKEEFYELFKPLGECVITPKQLETVNYYWGDISPLPPEDIRNRLMNAKQHYERAFDCTDVSRR